MKVKIEELKINPFHKEIYQTNDIDELKQSIQEVGLLEKIVVNTLFIIISGLRRYLAIKELGWETVDVEIKDINPDDELLHLISFNKQRNKTNREILNEAKYLKSIWGQKRGRKSATDNVIQLDPVKVDTRKRIADKLKISTGNLSKLEMIDRISPELIDEIDNGNADRTINQAHEIVSGKGKKLKVTRNSDSGEKNRNWMDFNVKDEYYTPRILVEPIVKYLRPGSTIWCPFDTENSQFVRTFQEKGFNVIYSHIWDGQDFFDYEPDTDFDYIVSNGPFSRKLEVFERLYKLNKPFAMVNGLPILNYQEIGEFFVGKDLQLLIVDKKVSFDGKTSSFNNSYFCKDVLPKALIFTHLRHNNSNKYFIPSQMYEKQNGQFNQAA